VGEEDEVEDEVEDEEEDEEEDDIFPWLSQILFYPVTNSKFVSFWWKIFEMLGQHDATLNPKH
jgi:hypothetical protein